MKVIRRLSRRGNSCHVSVPPQMIDYMRWRISDAIVVEVRDADEIVMRRVRPADLVGTSVPPMNLELPPVSTK